MYLFSGYEILIVLVIVIVLFGPERIAKYAKEFGKSIAAFLNGLKDRDDYHSEDNPKPQNETLEN